MKVAISSLALLLAGCATHVEPPILPPLYPQMTADVRASCDTLPAPPSSRSGTGVTMGQLYDYNDQVVGLYVVCAVRDRAKADWIKAVKPQ